MAAQRIIIPYSPRKQFRDYHDRKQRWACIVAHRRAGKTVACVNDDIRFLLQCKLHEPRAAYIAPTYTQAKDVAWSYVKHYTAAIPGCSTSESELSITLPNGARYRLYGAENYDRLRGLYLDHVTIDESGLIDPRAYPEVIRPALSDRQGSATFIGTPNGKNFFHDVHQQAQKDDDWFSLVMRASETGIIPPSELADAAKLMTPDQYAQEYECSFDAAIVGAIFGKEMRAAEESGRVTTVSYDPAVPVFTGWDLGINDPTVIWFGQQVGSEIHLIDYYQASDENIAHYAKVVKEKPYVYETHLLPHDAAARERGSGKTVEEFLTELNLDVRVIPNTKIKDQIEAAKMALPRCWFDADRCGHGIEALKEYRTEYDEKRKVHGLRPYHDWASHPADAFKTLILGLERPATPTPVHERAPTRYGWMS